MSRREARNTGSCVAVLDSLSCLLLSGNPRTSGTLVATTSATTALGTSTATCGGIEEATHDAVGDDMWSHGNGPRFSATRWSDRASPARQPPASWQAATDVNYANSFDALLSPEADRKAVNAGRHCTVPVRQTVGQSDRLKGPSANLRGLLSTFSVGQTDIRTSAAQLLSLTVTPLTISYWCRQQRTRDVIGLRPSLDGERLKYRSQRCIPLTVAEETRIFIRSSLRLFLAFH